VGAGGRARAHAKGIQRTDLAREGATWEQGEGSSARTHRAFSARFGLVRRRRVPGGQPARKGRALHRMPSF